MATSKIMIDEGSTTNLATTTVLEDAVTKHISRSILNKSDGTEIATASNPVRTDPTGTTVQPVSASSLPLPSGASTSANQSTEIASLSSIDGKLTDVATQTTLALIKAKTDNLDIAISGIKTGTDKIVTGALTESDFDAKTGSLTETAPVTDTASSGLNGRLQRIAQRLTSLIALLPTSLGTNGGLKTDNLSQPARVATTDTITAKPATDKIMNDTTALTPKFAKIDISASSDIVALVASKKLRIISMFLIASADCTLKFQSGAATDLQGIMTLKAGSGFVLTQNQFGWFETASGEKLNAVVSGTTQISGSLTYIEV